MLELVDEFKTRHASITKLIDDTYLISNKLLDFIEKEIVIDYHLRGE